MALETRNHMPPLITNVFPFSLVRRKMLAEPMQMDDVITIARTGQFESAWGHANTIKAVNDVLGADITPREARPAVILDGDNFPTLYGQKFTTVFLISPNFVSGFRPAIGEEVGEEKIKSWSALRLNFDVE
jgi:hypothetical protein